MSIVEILGVASIILFMSLVGDMSQLEKDTFIAEIYTSSGITSEAKICIFDRPVCFRNAIYIHDNFNIYYLGTCNVCK